MLRWITFVVLFSLAACQSGTAPTPTIEPTLPPTPDEVAQVSADGVTLAIRTPRGWQSVPNDRGILLAEHTDLNGEESAHGMLVYVFVQGIADLDMTLVEDDNTALELLNHVTKLPDDSLLDATISETESLRVGLHDGAYYLLSDGHGNRTLVLALSGDGTDKVIVCNVSASYEDEGRIRDVLPVMLAGLTIDGQAVDLSGLDLLPNPLVFPTHSRQHDYDATREAEPDSTPEW